MTSNRDAWTAYACHLLQVSAIASVILAAPRVGYAQQLPATPVASSVAPIAAPVAPEVWPAGEVTKELARCAQLLRGLDIIAKPLPPLRDQDCGAAAPLELISVGRSPQVSFSPPVTVTCDLAAALHKWIKGDLQPLARKHLGAEIVRIDTMSSYSCRTAYSRKNAKLSEHGKANAVDLRAFMTAKGGNSEVLANWGPTGKEIAAQVAAAKKFDADHAVARAPAAAGTVVARQAMPLPSSSAVATGTIVPAGTPNGIALAPPVIAIGPRIGGSIGLPLPTTGTGLGLSNGFGSPDRLGGPKIDEVAVEATDAAAKTAFLRAAHDSACHIFGTVLGPEANAAHRNHFHVDMAERKIKGICE